MNKGRAALVACLSGLGAAARSGLASLAPLWHLLCWGMLKWAAHDMNPADPRYTEVRSRLNYYELKLPGGGVRG